MKWINVNERLPDNTEEVLVTDGLESYAIAYYKKADGYWEASYDLLEVTSYSGGCIIICGNITHWMPLPPKPQ